MAKFEIVYSDDTPNEVVDAKDLPEHDNGWLRFTSEGHGVLLVRADKAKIVRIKPEAPPVS